MFQDLIYAMSEDEVFKAPSTRPIVHLFDLEFTDFILVKLYSCWFHLNLLEGVLISKISWFCLLLNYIYQPNVTIAAPPYSARKYC